MTPIEYISSLIAGMEVSSIPVQKSELQLLREMIIMDNIRQNKMPYERATEAAIAEGQFKNGLRDLASAVVSTPLGAPKAPPPPPDPLVQAPWQTPA